VVALLCSGRLDVPVNLIAPIARVVDLEQDGTQRLYRAAAVDHGYEIGALEKELVRDERRRESRPVAELVHVC
jgi:hypothetical protein